MGYKNNTELSNRFTFTFCRTNTASAFASIVYYHYSIIQPWETGEWVRESSYVELDNSLLLQVEGVLDSDHIILELQAVVEFSVPAVKQIILDVSDPFGNDVYRMSRRLPVYLKLGPFNLAAKVFQEFKLNGHLQGFCSECVRSVLVRHHCCT